VPWDDMRAGEERFERDLFFLFLLIIGWILVIDQVRSCGWVMMMLEEWDTSQT
jgi:hypothetical protein